MRKTNSKNAIKQSFGLHLNELRRKKNVSVRTVAKATDISNPFLYQVEKGDKSITDPTMYRKLASFFEVPVEDLLKKGGYLPNIDPNKKLNEKYKKVLNSGNWGNKIQGEATPEIKKFIVGMYEKLSKEKL